MQGFLQAGPVDYIGHTTGGLTCTPIRFDLKHSKSKGSLSLSVPGLLRPQQLAELRWCADYAPGAAAGLLVMRSVPRGEMPHWYWIPAHALLEYLPDETRGGRVPWEKIARHRVPNLASQPLAPDYLEAALQARRETL